MFCEAVKVDMENSKKLSFHHTIASTHSLITVLFEDLFEAITLHREFSGEKVRLKPSTLLLNKTDTCDGYVFNIDIFTDEVNALQKELLVLFEGFCIFGYMEAYKNLLCILMVVNKTIYGNNGDVPDKLLNMFRWSSPGIRNHMNRQVVAPDPESPQSYYWFNIPCPHCLQCQPFMTNLELDGIEIELILTITSLVISRQMKWVMWHNKKKNLQHHNSWNRITLL
jgi:hypothetical protein